MKLTFRPRRSLLLSRDLNVWKWKMKAHRLQYLPNYSQMYLSWWYLRLCALTAKMESSGHMLWVITISSLFFQCHTHPHPTIRVTVPELSQHQWIECCRRITWQDYTNANTGPTKKEDKALEVHLLFSIFEEGHRSVGMARLPALIFHLPTLPFQFTTHCLPICTRKEMIQDYRGWRDGNLKKTPNSIKVWLIPPSFLLYDVPEHHLCPVKQTEKRRD